MVLRARLAQRLLWVAGGTAVRTFWPRGHRVAAAAGPATVPRFVSRRGAGGEGHCAARARLGSLGQEGSSLTLCLVACRPSLSIRNLVAQLDLRRNGPLVPERITYAANKKLWWRCPEGPDHVWAAVVSHRTTRGDRCPFCANQRVSVTNALSKLAPAIARQWHPTLNGELRARDVVLRSHRRVWWRCPKGPDHVWRVAVDNRTTAG